MFFVIDNGIEKSKTLKLDTSHSVTKFWVTVIETKDVAPRRKPDLPNIYVKTTNCSPNEMFQKLQSGKSKSWASQKVRALLVEQCSGPYRDRIEANKSSLLTRERLSEEGYTVNKDTTTWRIYVIELLPDKSPDGVIVPLYVGETSKSPEQRFIEHRDELRNMKGKLYSKDTRGSVKKLRYDLFPNRTENCFFSRNESVNAEARWILKLKGDGYFVYGGHNTTKTR